MTDKSKNKLTALLLTAALLAACLGVVAILDTLPMPGAASQARRAAAANRALRASSRASQQHWRRVWTCPVGASLTDVPAPWSNGWIAVTERGDVVALDNSGRVRWAHAFSNASFVGSSVVAGTNVVVLERDGKVTALHVATGKLLWQVEAPGGYRHGPLAVRHGDTEQVVLLSAADGVLQALDLKDGHTLWQSEPTNRTDGSPGSDGRILAYGNCDSAVHIFSLTNGAQLAQIPVGAEAQMAGGVLLRDGRIYGGTRAGSLICIDAASNCVSWQAQVANGEAFNTPVAVRDLVVMSARDGNVTAFDAQSGAPRWRVSLSNAVDSLCIVDDAVFTVAGGSVVGLRAKDGGLFLQLPVGDDVNGPVWNGHVLAVAADGGNIIGFRGE